MPVVRRTGSKKSQVRAAIIQAGIEVLSSVGMPGLTAAEVAKRVGVKPHMVHYYFRTMDDLVVEMVRFIGREGTRQLAHALVSERPLHAIWEIERGSRWGVMGLEIQAIAAHSDRVRAEFVRYVEEMRFLEAEAVSRYFALRNFDCPADPLVVVQIIVGMARQLVREQALGLELGHDELVQAIEQFLALIPGEPARKKARARQMSPIHEAPDGDAGRTDAL